jgi:hypothetical protein
MSSFALDDDGDLLFENGNLSLTTGLEAIRQHVQVRFNFFLGEWGFDTTLGVPWFQSILVKAPAYAVVSQILKNVILNTPGVIELTEFSFDYDSATREASLNFKATTEDGDLDYSQQVALF